MLRRIPRLLRRAVIVAVLLAVSASVYQSWSAGSPGSGGWVQTETGPIGPADRDLLVKVRLAGLWEGPTGQQAEQQASRTDVREVGRKLAAEHAQLDEEVRKVANKLGVLLPSSPSSQQVAWMNEISSQSGSDYDRVFVQRLREAHAIVLPVISQVRATTRNDDIRQFATTAAEFVTRHHEYLESTGLVDYSALPDVSPGLLSGGTNPRDLIVPGLVFIATLLAAIALFWALRQRNAGRRERVTLPDRAAPMSGLTTVAALPGPRTTADFVPDQTGPIPVLTETGVSGSGSYRSDTDTGSNRWSAGSSRRSATDTGSFAAAAGTATATLTDTGPHRAVTDTGSHRTVSDSGSHRPVSDSGSHRAVSDSGAHRLPRSRGRHKMKR
jgi:predicted outer membrane protein